MADVPDELLEKDDENVEYVFTVEQRGRKFMNVIVKTPKYVSRRALTEICNELTKDFCSQFFNFKYVENVSVWNENKEKYEYWVRCWEILLKKLDDDYYGDCSEDFYDDCFR